MKRSEVVKKIHEFLTKEGEKASFYGDITPMYGGYDGEVYVEEILSENLLKLIEELGMKPPLNKSKSFQVCDENGEMTYEVHEWEE